MESNTDMKRVTYFILLLAGLAMALPMRGQEYLISSYYQTGGTNITKTLWPGFTNSCAPLTRYYLQEQFHETKSVTVTNDDGSVNWQGQFTYDATTVYDPGSETETLTNVTGSFSYSDGDETASGTADATNGWTIVIIDDSRNPPVTNSIHMGVGSDGQDLDWDGNDPYTTGYFNLGLWSSGASGWDAGQSTDTRTETQDDLVINLTPEDLDATTGQAENKMTYNNEYSTSDLLQPFGTDTNWNPGLGGAELDIPDDQSGINMSGSRTKFMVNVPAGQQFVIPYILHVHLDGVDTNELPGVEIAPADFYQTNMLSGMGFGGPMLYPSGKGLFLQPPYSQVNNGCADFYYGGSANVSLMGWICLPDGKDLATAPWSPLCPCCTGMPKWWVSEPYINLWAADKPVDYVTSLDEKIGFTITYKQRDTRPSLINGQPPFMPINGWNNNWYSYVHFVGVTTTNADGSPFYDFSQWTATIYEPNGGEGNYDYSGSPDATSGDQLLPLDGVPGDVSSFGFRLVHSDGSQEVYATVTQPYPTNYTEVVPIIQDSSDRTLPLVWLWGDIGYAGEDYEAIAPQGVGTCTPVWGSGANPQTNNYVKNPAWADVLGSVTNWAAVKIAANPSADALLTEHIDAQGHAIHLYYSGGVGSYYLQSVVDYDGNTTTFGYDTNGYITSVNMPYGRTATFEYAANTNAQLLSVTDAQGMTSSFAYNYASGFLEDITTPYGTTGFGCFETNQNSHCWWNYFDWFQSNRSQWCRREW